MRLSVATNFDDRLIELIRGYPVFEVYGKLPSDLIGGGRASLMLGPLSAKQLRRHIEIAHRRGIQFNYLLNASCLDNIELTRKGRQRIYRMLQWLRDLEVDAVTVAIPFLLEFIKHHFPHFKVRVSVFAEADHVLNVKHWAAMGADSITLNSPFVNRDFATLAEIRRAVTCDLQLLVNNSCLQSCPYTAYHKVLLAHASQARHSSGGFFIDYCYLKCSFLKLLDPVNYIRSDWIRPEDLPRYESLGYETFKLTERNAPTETMILRVKAYSERRYEGNLLDLVQPFAYPAKGQEGGMAGLRRAWWLGRYLYRPWKARWSHLRHIKELAEKRGMLHPSEMDQPIFVDNRALDGFLDHFPENCRGRDCERCRYCHRWAERAVQLNPQYRQECLNLYQKVFRDLLTI
jgi:collagenase-like PrtC family protease